MKTLMMVVLTLSAPPGPSAPATPVATFATPYTTAFNQALAGTDGVATRRTAPPGPLVLRGQAPVYDESGAGAAVAPPTTTYVPPGPVSPYGDPFLGGAPAVDPYGHAVDPNLGYGTVGPQPYRFGWTSRYDVGWIPSEGSDQGDFEVFEVNTAWRYTTGYPSGGAGWIFSWTPEFNYRGWQGPGGVDLPGSVYRFASDFELSTPASNPFSVQLGFTPAIASDLQQSLGSDAYQFDGRAVGFIRASPELMIALGVTVLDRVDEHILPYAGIVWTPNPYWEFRLLYPKSRISLFLGDFGGTSAWLYTGVEYNIEAYAIDLASPSGKNEQIEIADYRWTVGLRTESFGVTSFIEGGYVFAREVEFKYGTPGFGINEGFMLRGGLRF